MIKLTDIRTIVRVNAPYDKGILFNNGIRFAEDATKFSITFDGNVVPYIPYTEYEWIHERWKGKKNPNEMWIRENTVNDLNFMINSATQKEYKTIMKAHNRTKKARENMISQGTLQSIKGNKR